LSTLTRVGQLTQPGKGGTQNINFTANANYIAAAHNTPLLINVETEESLSLVSSEDKKTPLKVEQQGNQVGISLGSMQDD